MRTPNGSVADGSSSAQDGRDVYLVLDQAEEYFLYHADDAGPGSFAEALPGDAGCAVPRQRARLAARGLARQARSLHRPDPRPLREHSPPRPARPPGGPRGDRPPGRAVRRAHRRDGRPSSRGSSSACSTRSGRAQIEPALGGLGVGRGRRGRRADRGAVPPARHAAAVGRRAGGGLGRPAGRDARAARRRAAHRRGASRGRDGRADAASRRTSPRGSSTIS